MKQLKIELGDVYTLPFSSGLIILQYVATGKNGIDIVRVFRVPCENGQEVNIAETVSGSEEFFLHFALQGAARKKIVSFAGHYPFPVGCSTPRLMRTMIRRHEKDEPQWFIVDVETLERKPVAELTNEIIKLSPFGIWNDTLLVDRMGNGWSLQTWK